MRFVLLALFLFACGDEDPPSAHDLFEPPLVDGGGACDAAPVDLCGECADGLCVHYDTQSGFSSCTDFDACVTTTLDCPPGTCTAECEAALCPEGYTCDPAATGRYTCTRP